MTVTSTSHPANTAADDRVTVPAPRRSARPLVGHFRLELPAGTWEWSAGLAALLGLPPGTRPSIDLLLEHVHPGEHTALLGALAGCTQGVPFSAEHRVLGPGGSPVLTTVVGEPVTDDDGRVSAVSGVVLAVPTRKAASEDADRVRALETEVEQLRTAMASRAQIEQAKGVLMLLTGFTEQACFDLLGHISSHTHRKVRDLAGEIVASAAGRSPLPEDIRTILRDACPPPAAGG